MEILHFVDGINPLVMEESIKLAVEEAHMMVGYHIESDSPLMPLARAEVEILLTDSLSLVGAGLRQKMSGEWTELKVGLIAALDDEGEMPRLAGFIQYKPRLMVSDAASIGYAAVAKDYRGQGVFTRLLAELKNTYPILGLDCPLELVEMYEKLGFRVSTRQNAHVGMRNAHLAGKTWMPEQAHLEDHEVYRHTEKHLCDSLGSQYEAVYAAHQAANKRRMGEIDALLATRRLVA